MMPKHDTLSELVEGFASFFESKIVKIRDKMPQNQLTHVPLNAQSESIEPLSTFEQTTVKEILQLISHSKAKSCELDPIPTWLLKSCVEVITPFLVLIANLSLEQCHMPDCLKLALVRPLLKKNRL